MAECSRREISSGQARQKLVQWISKDSPLTEKQEKEIGEIISSLKKDKYIDDARFAKAFTRDKLRFSKWGPEKILRGLSDAGVDKSIDILSKKRQDLEKKAEKKAAEDHSKLESLERRLKDLDVQKKDYYKQKTALLRKIYALQTKIRTSSFKTKAVLVAFAQTKGFSLSMIEKNI